MKGGFGNAYLENVADYYGSNPLGGLPPLGSMTSSLHTKDLDARRKFLSDGTDTTGMVLLQILVFVENKALKV